MENYKDRTGRTDVSEWAIFSGTKQLNHFTYPPILEKSNEEPQNLCTRALPTNPRKERSRSETLERRTSSSSSFIPPNGNYKPAYVSEILKLPLKMPIKQEYFDYKDGGFLTPTSPHFKPKDMDSVEGDTSCGMTGSTSSARKERAFMPDSRKDDGYWVKRRKNNEAAKRSREKRRAIDSMLENTVVALNEENSRLKRELELFKESRIVESTKHSSDTAPPVTHFHAEPKERLNDHVERKALPYDLVDRNPAMTQLHHNGIYPYTSPSIRSDLLYQNERFISQFIATDKQVYYQVPSTNGPTQPEENQNHHSPLPTWQPHTVMALSSKGQFDADEPVTKKTKIDVEDCNQYVETDIVHGDADINDNTSEDTSKSDADVNSDQRSSHSPGRLSPTHSAFASGIDAKRLPHKLRAKLGAVSPTQNNTSNSPPLPSPELADDSSSLSRVNLEMFNSDDSAQSDLRDVRLKIGGICTPPSSTTSDDASIVETNTPLLTTKKAQTVEKTNTAHSFEIKQEPLDWNDNVETSSASAQARLSRERMLKAAQALTEMEASEARTAQTDDQSSQMSTDSKYWEKRRRNNLAARKCRESKRLLHEYRCARASYLEHENNQLHSEINMLTKDVASLREMLKVKQQLRVA